MNFPPKGNFLRRLSQHMHMFEVLCSEMPNMKVSIREGSFWDNGTNFVEFPGGISKEITAPSVGAKIVLVGITTSGAISIIDGEASTTSPKPPLCPKNVLPCAVILLQSTSTAITQEMIYDCRPVFYTRYPVSHNDLLNRDQMDAHSIDSITGLQDALDDRPNEEQLSQWLNTKADMIGTNSSRFIFNRAGSGVPTQDLDLVFERGTTLNSILRFSKEAEGGLLFSNDNGTTWVDVLAGSGPGTDVYSKEEVDELLEGKEDLIEKKSAFNCDFGLTEGTVAAGDHAHDGIYAGISHDHASLYSAIDHNHNELYSAIDHDHASLYAGISHNHDDKYSAITHNHDSLYSPVAHNHDSLYSPIDHNHDELYAEKSHSHPELDQAPSARIYVDGSVSSSGNGSVLKPFKTLAEAAAIAEDGDTVMVATGSYDEDVVFAPGVSVHGSSVKAILKGNVVFGNEEDSAEHTPVSVRDIQFGAKNSTKKVMFFYTAELFNCVFYSVCEFDRNGKSMTLISCNFRAQSEQPAVKFSGSLYTQLLGTDANSGSGRAMEIASGMATINDCVIKSANADATLNVLGTINLVASQVLNTAGGSSINMSSSAATAANPNALSGAVCAGNIEAGSKPVIAEGVLMASGSFNGNAIIMRKSSQIANDSEVEGATVKDALDNLFNDLEESVESLEPVVTKCIRVDKNRTDEYDADGSELRPFKTLGDAAAAAESGDVIIAAHGTYTEDVVLPSGVSLHGESLVSVQINGDLTVGGASENTHPVSLKNIIFGTSGLTKEVNINCTCEMTSCYAYIPVIFGNSNASATCFNTNFEVNSSQPAVSFSGTLFNHTVGKFINHGNGKALVMNSGMATITNGVFESSNTEETIKVGNAATLNLINSQVQNNAIEQGGIAIDLSSSAASQTRPNGLTGVIALGDIKCGAKTTFVSGYKFIIHGSLIGSALEFPASKIAMNRPANPVNGDFWIE